jgi:hypothetical protein
VSLAGVAPSTVTWAVVCRCVSACSAHPAIPATKTIAAAEPTKRCCIERPPSQQVPSLVGGREPVGSARYCRGVFPNQGQRSPINVFDQWTGFCMAVDAFDERKTA